MKRHPAVRTGDQLSLGERVADWCVRAMGSWTFIIAQTIIVSAWIALNIFGGFHHWDGYPFILLNLAFSTQAAYAAPLILLAARRQDQRNSEVAQADLLSDRRSETILRSIAAHLGVSTGEDPKEFLPEDPAGGPPGRTHAEGGEVLPSRRDGDSILVQLSPATHYTYVDIDKALSEFDEFRDHIMRRFMR